jgi:hypothetical protein
VESSTKTLDALTTVGKTLLEGIASNGAQMQGSIMQNLHSCFAIEEASAPLLADTVPPLEDIDFTPPAAPGALLGAAPVAAPVTWNGAFKPAPPVDASNSFVSGKVNPFFTRNNNNNNNNFGAVGTTGAAFLNTTNKGTPYNPVGSPAALPAFAPPPAVVEMQLRILAADEDLAAKEPPAKAAAFLLLLSIPSIVSTVDEDRRLGKDHCYSPLDESDDEEEEDVNKSQRMQRFLAVIFVVSFERRHVEIMESRHS